MAPGCIEWPIGIAPPVRWWYAGAFAFEAVLLRDLFAAFLFGAAFFFLDGIFAAGFFDGIGMVMPGICIWAADAG